jgi:uncharacterized protein (TIGR00661 family)
MLTLCKLEHQAKNWFSRITASVVTECHYVGAVAYVIVNFFKAPLRIDSAILAPPIIRPAVSALQARQGGHILIYSTTGKGADQLRQMLCKFPSQKFYVYGFNDSTEFKNFIFKKRSTEGFLADLAAARAVVASAGFSLISECMHLKKKMLLLPVAGQYEQIINAHYIQKLGLGIASEKLDEGTLACFLEELDKPLPDDERIIWPDNNRFFQILQTVLNKLHKPINITLC